jgi:hypothetical protein
MFSKSTNETKIAVLEEVLSQEIPLSLSVNFKPLFVEVLQK